MGPFGMKTGVFRAQEALKGRGLGVESPPKLPSSWSPGACSSIVERPALSLCELDLVWALFAIHAAQITDANWSDGSLEPEEMDDDADFDDDFGDGDGSSSPKRQKIA